MKFLTLAFFGLILSSNAFTDVMTTTDDLPDKEAQTKEQETDSYGQIYSKEDDQDIEAQEEKSETEKQKALEGEQAIEEAPFWDIKRGR